MLEMVDLSQKLKKGEYNSIITDLELRLGALQRQAWKLEIPVVIVFEGWVTAGKGRMINQLLLSLDPRGCNVHPINQPDEEEQYRPYLWRFWIKTPERGRIAIFDRSWYRRVLLERAGGGVDAKVCENTYEDILAFERQLVDDGNLMIKFFLHISRKKQNKRFKKLVSNPFTAWKIKEEDWVHHWNYERYLKASNETLNRTDTEFAPWTVVEANNWRFASVKIFRTAIAALERKIEEVKACGTRPPASPPKLKKVQDSALDRVDMSHTLRRKEYNRALKKYQKRIRDLEHEVYLNRIPLVIVYEGWDAAGKGGNIKRLVRRMDPRGYEVIPVAAPNDIEKAHHYLWRFWMNIPKAGHFAIFDRSWYGRVLVERIEGFCSEAEWMRAYREINEMEAQLVDFGTVLLKFWLHIDEDEQLQRFQARQVNPYKQWKINEEDWRNREKWDQYKVAVDEMLDRTNTPHAPWTVIEANSKLFARIKALQTVVQQVEHICKERL